MRFCASQLQPIESPSKSDPYKKYVVELRPVDSAHPKCSCMAWIMARSRARKALGGREVNADLPGKCKHLDAARKQVCDWEGADDIYECPKCEEQLTIDVGDTASMERPALVEAPTGPAPTIGMPELRPMLAEEINADRIAGYVHDDKFWFQQKVDGHRVLIHIENYQVTVLGRGGQASQHGARFQRPAYDDLRKCPDMVIDGELVGDTLWVFDCPHDDGEKIGVGSPYRERLEALERTFNVWRPDERFIRLLPTAKTAVDKAQLALHLLQTQAEGVMIKDAGGEYQPGGRGRLALKAKYVKDIDCVVSNVGEKGKDNYTLSVHRDGTLVEIGRCSSIGKVTCTVGDVVTVRYLYLAENDRLYQPRLMAKRADKTTGECDWHQLDHAKVNKTVHSALTGMEVSA